MNDVEVTLEANGITWLASMIIVRQDGNSHAARAKFAGEAPTASVQTARTAREAKVLLSIMMVA